MAVQFPDLFIQWTDGTTRQVTPGTTSGTYTITNDGTSTGTIVEDGDVFTLSLTNLKSIGIQHVYFPWQSVEEPLGGSANDDLHYIPRLGGVKYLNNMFTAFGWNGFYYPGQVFSPFMIRADDSEARIVAAANWPPKKCELYFSLNRNVILYIDEYISRSAGSSPTFTAKAIYKKVTGTSTISQPLWMVALDYFKNWLKAQMRNAGLEPPHYPDWMKSIHGFYNVQLQNIFSFDAADLETTFKQWSDYLPWLQMWGQMSPNGGGCCLRDKTIHARYTGLTTLATNLVNEGYRVGFYTRVPDIIAEVGNYIQLDNATQKIDDTPTNIQTISDNSVSIFLNTVFRSGGWSGSVAVNDIINLTKSGYSEYVTIKRIGTAADGDSTILYIDRPISFASGLNASVDRYSGGTETSLEYLISWAENSIGGSYNGNTAYLDVLGVVPLGDPSFIAEKLRTGYIDYNTFTEGSLDIHPQMGSLSGSIAIASLSIDSGSSVASITVDTKTVTRSSGVFSSNIREWDAMFVGSGLFLVDSTTPARTNLSYTFSTNTAAPPTSGQVRFNNATYGSATTIYIHNNDANAVDRSATIGSGYSRIRVYKTGDNTIYLDATVSGISSAGTYVQVTITPVTTTNSFANGDAITVELSPDVTSITTKAAALQTYTNQNYSITRYLGSIGKTTSKITSTLDNTIAFPELIRYTLSKRLFLLGESNIDFWYWGNIRGANYWIERQAFLLGAKFDAITPEDTFQGHEIDVALKFAIDLRNAHKWWDRDCEYNHQIGISNITNPNVDIRRFTDAGGYELFVVDNWDQTGSGTFDFNGTTYYFTNDQLQIIDTFDGDPYFESNPYLEEYVYTPDYFTPPQNQDENNNDNQDNQNNQPETGEVYIDEYISEYISEYVVESEYSSEIDRSSEYVNPYIDIDEYFSPYRPPHQQGSGNDSDDEEEDNNDSDNTGDNTEDNPYTENPYSNQESAKLLLRPVNKNITVDLRSTRFLLNPKNSNNHIAVQWQIFGYLVPDDMLPEWDLITPLSENTPNIVSNNKYELNIILAENRKYRVRVRFYYKNGKISGWSNYFDFISKTYEQKLQFKQTFFPEKTISTQGITLNFST